MDNSQARRPDEDRAGRRRAAIERSPFRPVSDFLWQVAPTAWARVLFVLQTAPRIVPHPSVIDAVLRYFQTGVLPPRIRPTGLLFEGRDMLRFREQVLVVDEVDRERYWLFPIIEEARVSFRVIDDPRRACERMQSPEGKCRTRWAPSPSPFPAPWHFSRTWTSSSRRLCGPRLLDACRPSDSRSKLRLRHCLQG
ncbi:MAG: hypothetical protein ACRERE_11530 [Candidatus Entotheonellia bacterium]